MTNNRYKSISMTIGVLFYALPVLINQWTLMYFFGDYIGDTLSGYMVMLLWLFAAVSVATGWAFIHSHISKYQTKSSPKIGNKSLISYWRFSFYY